ncbi:MAG: hypothetical protein CMJ83_13285 [Planctomycetes bacterium]|nr:hypothetical protein [Planctomycetota bacterium]
MAVRDAGQTASMLCVLFAISMSAFAQPTESGGQVDVFFGPEGITLDQAIEWASTSTGRPFQFNETHFRGKGRIMMTGRVSVPKSRIYELWQAIFVTQGFAMIPLGPGEGDFIQLALIDQSRELKQRSTYVQAEKLHEYRTKVGTVVMTTVPLKHVKVESVRNAVTQLMTNRAAEFSAPVPSANSLILVGFAPTVYSVYQVLMAMDQPAESTTLKFEILSLEHAVAEELQPMINELLTAQTSGGAGRGRVGGAGGSSIEEVPAPQILPDMRTNSLVVYAVERHMNEIKRLVAALDTATDGVPDNIRIYFLKNTNAPDMERTLRDLLGQTASQRSNSPVGRPGATGPTSGNARGSGVVIVADDHTNSLLIQCTKTRYQEIEHIIDELDRRRPQVLVHAVIAELSDTDMQNIAVELTAIQGGDDRYRFGGGTGFGLSQTTIAEDTSGGFLDDLVRIPFATGTGIGFTGLAAGIFERNMNVPLLVSMLKSYTKVNLLSNASVLTNDNQQSTLTVGRTLNILSSETTAAGLDRTTASDEVDANLTLSISPHISNDGHLRLDIDLSVVAFQGFGDPNNGLPPPRTSRTFNGSVTVPNGKTVIIGGLVQDNTAETVTGIPFLSDIPILGELFKSTNTSVEKTTLYLFVTPTIIDDFKQLEEISYQRKLEIQKLNGNLNLIDPNFRAAGIGDLEVDADALEDAGVLDLPSYSPVTEQGLSTPPREIEGNPLRPRSRKEEPPSVETGTVVPGARPTSKPPRPERK